MGNVSCYQFTFFDITWITIKRVQIDKDDKKAEESGKV